MDENLPEIARHLIITAVDGAREVNDGYVTVILPCTRSRWARNGSSSAVQVGIGTASYQPSVGSLAYTNHKLSRVRTPEVTFFKWVREESSALVTTIQYRSNIEYCVSGELDKDQDEET